MTTPDLTAPEPTAGVPAISVPATSVPATSVPAIVFPSEPPVTFGQPFVAPQASVPVAAQAAPVELVGRGLLFSLGAIPVGMLAAVVIWKMGFVASISSFVIAGGATMLYAKGAGAAPRRGLLPVIGVILVGVAASFFAIVAADIVDAYHTEVGQSLGYASWLDMVTANLFNPDVISSYGQDGVMFVAFAALGVFGTMRRLLAARRA
jgi:hypothetical protein